MSFNDTDLGSFDYRYDVNKIKAFFHDHIIFFSIYELQIIQSLTTARDQESETRQPWLTSYWVYMVKEFSRYM